MSTAKLVSTSPRAASLTPLIVGRDDALRRLEALALGGARIITILGPPGIGKTTLARAFLEQRDAGRFCDLSSASTKEDLLVAVLERFGERAHVTQAELEDRVCELLVESEESVLVLDNFEQLAHTSELLARWCDAAQGTTVIVTSRERLGLAAETVLELSPLGCPDERASPTVVLASDAVRLFVARASAAGGAVDDAPELLGAVVRAVDGIPLAIELAAASTRILSLSEIAQRLRAGHGVLTAAPSRRADRHETLATAIAWSWNLLSDAEKCTLARLSVFAGAFELSAAEVITESLPETVAALRDKSLVHTTPDGRLALYVAIRHFASAKLDAQDPNEAHAIRTRAARHYAALAARFNASRRMQDREPDATIHRAIRSEKENLVTALSVAHRLPLSRESVEVEVELGVALAYLLALPSDDLMTALSRALARAEAIDAPVLQAHVLCARQSINAIVLGDFDAAMRDLARVQAMARIAPGLRALARIYAGIQLRFQGHLEQSLASHLEAREELESLSLRRLTLMNDACLGRLMGDLGRTEEAFVENRRALDGGDAIGDIWLGALALGNLAQVEQERGNFDRAEEFLDRSLARLQSAGEVLYLAIYSTIRGDLFFETGRFETARFWYEQSTRAGAGTPEHRQTAFSHAALGALDAKEGDRVGAARHLDLAERSARRSGSTVVRVGVEILRGVAELYRATEDRRAAVTAEWRQRLSDHRRRGNDGGGVDVRFALRMLEKTLDTVERPLSQPLLRVAADGSWFETEEGGRADLGKRPSMRRIFAELVKHHAQAPGQGIATPAMIEAGWPGERILPFAAATRVRVAVSTLRRLGLRSFLITREDGYLIDPHARIVTEELARR